MMMCDYDVRSDSELRLSKENVLNMSLKAFILMIYAALLQLHIYKKWAAVIWHWKVTG